MGSGSRAAIFLPGEIEPSERSSEAAIEKLGLKTDFPLLGGFWRQGCTRQTESIGPAEVLDVIAIETELRHRLPKEPKARCDGVFAERKGAGRWRPRYEDGSSAVGRGVVVAEAGEYMQVMG